MVGEQELLVHGDRALNSGDEDKLGFREVAQRIATSVVDRATEDGLVIGIEGAWGAGKSSLLYLISDELEKLPAEIKPTVINFRPWLIGNREALITSLFQELSSQLDQVALESGDSDRVIAEKVKKARETLRGFMEGLSKTGAAIEFAGDASGFAWIKWIGKSVNFVSSFWSGEHIPTPLADLKGQLVKSLRDLGHRFIVTIDDVDRLEPAEVMEMLRLVRSVADFPNIIYILCYDGKTLAHSIEQATRVESGKEYLEKIVQLTVMVPKPEALQLRQWFSDELHQIATTQDEDELSRLKAVIGYDGGRLLRTPRAVIRTLDSIRFLWSAVKQERLDLADLVWLQLIKDGNPLLYRWIEEYCATAAALSLGVAEIEGGERKRSLKGLLSSVDSGYFDDLQYRYHFSEQLPLIGVSDAENGPMFKVYEVSKSNQSEAIHRRRLSSPDHYRLYFSFNDPSHVLTRGQVALLRASAEQGANDTGAVLLRLHGEKAAGSLTKADLILERTHSAGVADFSSVQCENLLIAFSNVMDEAYWIHPFDFFWFSSTWERADQLIPLLLDRVEQVSRRDAVISTMFAKGAALGWLTHVFRKEMFAHGRHGDQRRPEREWLFKQGEMTQITNLMLRRYKAMTRDDAIGCPDTPGVLFAWLQAGDQQGVRKFVEENIASESDLVEFIESLTGKMISSDRGELSVLREEDLSYFMDYGIVRDRINALRSHHELGERAKSLSSAFNVGKEY